MAFKIEYGEEQYRIIAPDGTEGDLAEFGELSDVTYQGKRHGALLDLDEHGNVISILGDKIVYPIGEGIAAEMEEVDFGEGEPEEEVEVEAEEDEGGEEEEPEE